MENLIVGLLNKSIFLYIYKDIFRINKMKSLLESLNDALVFEEEAEVFVVKDKDDGTIITVCDTEGQAKKAVSDAEKGNNYEIVKDKKSNYVK